jgi:hypothetical protein
MKKETQIYSDFIKRNNVKVTTSGYVFRGQEVKIYKTDDERYWYSELNYENCYTKKSAIYYCLKNRFNTLNGVIL